MKPVNLITLCMFLSFCFSAQAQTKSEIEAIKLKTNGPKLLQLSRENASRFKENYEKALRYARQKGWKIIEKTENGGSRMLYGITEDLKPIYKESLNRNAGITSRANTLYTGGVLNLNVNGESMTAGVWDNSALKVSHMAYENRAIQMDGATSSLDHATHVAGTIIAANFFTPRGRSVRGMAYKGNVHGYDWLNDRSEVASAALNGLLLSNHSYVMGSGYAHDGSGQYSFYDSENSNWDNVMYNAPYLLSVWAAGNIGGRVPRAYDMLATAAKNNIAVGAIEPVLNYTGPSSVIASSFTSRGPTDDGRIKPDIVASGDTVASTAVSNLGDYTAVGDFYALLSGTSMAAPSVTGTLLLLQQHYTNINGNFMRGATLKGLALHTADEAGSYPGPDITFGWGLINAQKAANTITYNGGKSFISEDSIATGGAYIREFVASGTEPLVATICWADLPGVAVADNNTTAQLVNDLDSRFTTDTATYYPWKLDPTNYTGPALKGDNARDNVEKIEISNPTSGQVYKLTVNHKGTLATNGQRFSIIVTGLEECVADRTISAPINSFSEDNQQASSSILASNNINAANVVYHAGDEVVLTDGFTAMSNSSFRAYIEGCTNNYNARTIAPEREVVYYDLSVEAEKKEEILPETAVYPNPGTGLFRVKLSALPAGQVEVFTLKGQKIFDRGYQAQDEMEVDIKNHETGIYILKVVTGEKTFVKRISKN